MVDKTKGGSGFGSLKTNNPHSLMRVAYLIIAHNEVYVLNRLIALLDWPGNSIFVLIDSKSDIIGKIQSNSLKYSDIELLQSGKITWGGFSLIEAELYLMKKAVQGKYDYYCLLSGVDLPLKSQDSIHCALRDNYGKEYVGINEGWLKLRKEEIRYNVFHPFQEYVGRKENALWALERIIVKIQTPFINRTKSYDMEFEVGPQWFCITNRFCEYVLSKEPWIKRTFRYTEFCDEVFLQTILINSEFNDNIYKPGHDQYEQCCRLIDWERGKPYVWRDDDYDDMINSSAWFARKFSTAVDKEIIDKIYLRLAR